MRCRRLTHHPVNNILVSEWLRRKRDYYYRKAKKESYRSRSAYKLLQAINRYRFVELGDVVVDLGAAPGGWLQVLRKIVGEEGYVLGVDIKEIKPLGYSNVFTIVGDVTDPSIVGRIKAILPRPADVVVSDVSPNVSGIWELDHARQIELAKKSLDIACSTLTDQGNFFAKVFQGDMLRDFIEQVKRYFSEVRLIKPKASRPESAELYLIGLRYKG